MRRSPGGAVAFWVAASRIRIDSSDAVPGYAIDILVAGMTPPVQFTTQFTPATRRWLNQRYLLTPADQLSVPVFGAWIEHQALV